MNENSKKESKFLSAVVSGASDDAFKPIQDLRERSSTQVIKDMPQAKQRTRQEEFPVSKVVGFNSFKRAQSVTSSHEAVENSDSKMKSIK